MPLNDLNFELATVGKPVEGGCLFIDFTGTATLPTNASSDLDANFLSLGELSEQGVTMKATVNSTKLKGWHGRTILTDSKTEDGSFTAQLVEVSREAAAKLRYGEDNVTASDGIVTKIVGKSHQNKQYPMVLEELESNGYRRRTVFYKAIISNLDDQPHQEGQLMIYGLEFSADEDVVNGAYQIFRAAPAAPAAQGNGN